MKIDISCTETPYKTRGYNSYKDKVDKKSETYESETYLKLR